MSEDSYKLIEWGLEEESIHQIKSQNLGTVVQFREKEFLVLGQKEITRFESAIVKESYPYILTALVPIPGYDILIGVTAVSAEFIILFMSDLKLNIKTGVKINDQSVFNIIFSRKSNSIITSGEHLITWKFKYTPPETTVVFAYPKIKISMNKIVLSHIHSSIINPPMFDFTKEELYINDNKGNIQSYSLNGNFLGNAIKYGSMSQTCCSYYEKNQYFMTTNTNQGAVLWPHRSGNISKRFFVGSSASLAIQFIDDECVAILDAKYNITIIDVKTSNFFTCYQSNLPVHRMFFFRTPFPRIVLCAGSSVILLKVNLPWRYWNSTFGKPISITRANKKNEAARITVVLENSHVRLISPKTSSILTAATLTSLSAPITCFYDRGNPEIPELANKRDQLLIPLQDGSMQIFSTGQDPCQMIGSIDFKITCICQCKYRGQWSFCFGTNVGQLLLYSYSTMKPLGRIICTYKYPIINLFFDKESQCLIVSFEECSCLLSLDKEKEVGDYIKAKFSKMSLFFDRIAIFAGNNGLITSLFVLNQKLSFHDTNLMRLHDDSITGFSLGSTYFVSSSIDKTVKVWSKDFHVMCKLVFPLPILQCCAMNGKRDILVATLNDIMIVKGSEVFGRAVDLEDDIIDNYDKKTDFLDNSFMLFKEEEEEKESLLAGRKKENDKKKNKVNARRKRIIEALKKQMSMMEAGNEDFEDEKEIEPPKNMVNLPKVEIQAPQKEIEEISKKNKQKEDDDEYSYEYVLEEEDEDDEKATSPQPKDSNKQSENDLKALKEKKERERLRREELEAAKKKEELEKQKKLLEKQKAQKEREDKEKEILKMFNESQKAKAIKEPTMKSRPRPQRPRAPQQKIGNDLDEEDYENEIGSSDDDNRKEKIKSESDQNSNSNEAVNANKNGKSKSSEKEPNKKTVKQVSKSKTEGKAKKNDKGKEDSSVTNKKDKDKEDSKNKKASKDDKNDKKGKNSESTKDNEASNNNKKIEFSKSKINKSCKNQNNEKDKEKSQNNQKAKGKSQNIQKTKEKSNAAEKSKDKTQTKDSNQNSETNKNQSDKKDKDKENKKDKKDNTEKKKTLKKSQNLNNLLKKGYKNTSSQTLDHSSLQKIGNIPKTVPSNVAVVPQIAKVKRIRRSPTPPTYRPHKERRPLFDPTAAHKRSSTPEPFRFLVDGSSPPVNLFFDINMVRKMVENGDKRYIPLLQLLEKQGLKSNKFPSVPISQPMNSASPPKKRRFVPNQSTSWGVMVTLPPITISQIKVPNQTSNPTSFPIHENEENLQQDKEISQNENNDIKESSSSNDELANNSKDNSKQYVNHEKERFYEYKPSIGNSSTDYSNDYLKNPSMFLDHQFLPMKKVHKQPNKPRGSSVPNSNKTVAEMKYCKEQLMMKIKEKRSKESIQDDENESIQKEEVNQFDENEISKNDEEQIANFDDRIVDHEENAENEIQEKPQMIKRNDRPPNTARVASFNFNPRFKNPITQSQESSREATFVEPIMPIYLRSSKDVRYIRKREISPFACKRYRMVVDSNGPKDAKNFQSHKSGSPNKNLRNSQKALIDQYAKPPRQLLKPLQMLKSQLKH